MHIGAQPVGRPRPSKKRKARVLYMRLDVASACNAFNGQSGGAKEQKKADFTTEKLATSAAQNYGGSIYNNAANATTDAWSLATLRRCPGRCLSIYAF